MATPYIPIMANKVYSVRSQWGWTYLVMNVCAFKGQTTVDNLCNNNSYEVR